VAVIFITGSDTGIGKTNVVGLLARELSELGNTQVIKPVESGATSGRPADAPKAAGDWATPITLFSFGPAQAPLAAAAQSGKKLSLQNIVKAYQAIPPADHQIIEGAGGLAVPIDPLGLDWTDFAQTIKPDAVIIVVEDRLGANNHARLSVAYLKRKYNGRIGVWLNTVSRTVSPETAQANRNGLKQSKIQLAGESSYQNKKVIFNPEFWS